MRHHLVVQYCPLSGKQQEATGRTAVIVVTYTETERLLQLS